MKKFLVVLLLMVGAASARPIKSSSGQSIRIVTYNIRRMGKDPIEYQWSGRKWFVFDLVKKIKPAIIGFQEVVKGEQYEDLKKALPQYGSFGESRSAKMVWGWQSLVMKHPDAKDECNPIFYDKSKVKLLQSGDFGINPGRIGSFFTASIPRICTWGRFKDIKTDKEFYVYNTHLDNTSSSIRNKQLKMIFENIKMRTQGIPVVFMGDFNRPFEVEVGEPVVAESHLEPRLELARNVAAKAEGPKETRTGWNDNELKAIDHILVSPKKVLEVRNFEVVVSPKGVYPSDHRPVFADIVLK